MVNPMMALNVEQLSLLYIMCNDRLFVKACKLLRRDAKVFQSRRAPYIDRLLNVYMRQRIKCRKSSAKVQNDKVAAMCLQDIEDQQLDVTHKQRAIQLVNRYARQTQQLDYHQGKEYLHQVVESYCKRQLSLALVNSPAIQTLQKLVEESRTFIADVDSVEESEDKPTSINILDNLPQLLKRRVLIQFGVPYFDRATCGGVCSKEMALIGAPTGGGKCQAYGTQLLMHDGQVVQIQDVRVGDLLMGPKNDAVRVVSTCKGHGPMYRITPAVGQSFEVNSYHILTLGVHGIPQLNVAGQIVKSGRLLDIPVQQYLQLDTQVKKHLFLVRMYVQLQDKDTQDDYYIQGICAGARVQSYDVKIPVMQSLKRRREFMAGVMDCCGVAKGRHMIISIPEEYAYAIARVARTSGLSVTPVDCQLHNDSQLLDMFSSSIVKLKLTGQFNLFPLRTDKAAQLSSTNCCIPFTIQRMPNANYYGFTLTGDGRYLHSDCIVTHNTMCATDLACAQARLGHLTMWFTYEQPFDGDIAQRIVANFTGLQLSSIRNLDYQAFTDQQKMLLNASTAGIADNLVGVDFSTNAAFDPADPQDIGGVYSIQRRIKQAEQRTGRKVKFVILDWFGQIISRLAAYSNIDLSTNYRHFSRTFLAQLRQMMQRMDVFILVFHQLSQKACDAKPTYVPNKTDFQDMKTLANNMQWCFTIGKRDQQNGVCWFNTDKARRCRPSLQLIQMDGQHARFKLTQDYIPDHRGHFINIKQPRQEQAGKPQLDGRTQDILRAYSL